MPHVRKVLYRTNFSQSIQQRMSLHRNDVRLRPDRCVLTQHSLNMYQNRGHIFDLSNPSIRAIEPKYKKGFSYKYVTFISTTISRLIKFKLDILAPVRVITI